MGVSESEAERWTKTCYPKEQDASDLASNVGGAGAGERRQTLYAEGGEGDVVSDRSVEASSSSART